MKINFFFTACFLFNLVSAQNYNSGTVAYKIEFIGKLSPNKEPYDKYVQILVPKINSLTYVLKFKDKKSFFGPERTLNNDFDKSLKSAITFVGKNTYFNNYDNSFFKQMDIAGDIFHIKLNKTPDWKIHSSQKKIGEFNCYKATKLLKIDNGKVKVSKTIEAWFTNEIPLSFGPKEHVGLPGLILELNDGDIKFTANAISFDEQSMDKPKKGIAITEEDLEIYIKDIVKSKWGIKE
jgi:GLPGLI family protein